MATRTQPRIIGIRFDMIYELRTYDLGIGKVPSYLKLFETVGYTILCRYATPVGFWFTETGVLNRVHHMWCYESRAQRAERRAALMRDAEWTGQFLPYALPHLARQTNVILELAEGAPGKHPRTRATDTAWLYDLTQVSAAEVALSDDATVGVFRATSGDLQQRFWLRAYQDEVDRAARYTVPDLGPGTRIISDTLHPAVFSALR